MASPSDSAELLIWSLTGCDDMGKELDMGESWAGHDINLMMDIGSLLPSFGEETFGVLGEADDARALGVSALTFSVAG